MSLSEYFDFTQKSTHPVYRDGYFFGVTVNTNKDRVES